LADKFKHHVNQVKKRIQIVNSVQGSQTILEFSESEKFKIESGKALAGCFIKLQGNATDFVHVCVIIVVKVLFNLILKIGD